MTESPGGPDFPSTQWSLVERARGPDGYLRREALGSLVQLYWPALRVHLVVRRRLAAEAAGDLLQGFAADRILQRRFLDHAAPAKGRFRSFLLRCLENYLIDHWRGTQRVEILDSDGQDEVAGRAVEDADVFEVAWARQVLMESLRRMWADCRNQGRPAVWSLFERRVVRPALEDAEPPTYESLIDEFGFKSVQQAANVLVTAKRHFRRVLEEVVAQYVESEAEVQAEIADLRSILAAAKPTEIPLPWLNPDDKRHEDAAFPIAGDESNPMLLARLFRADHDDEAGWCAADLEILLRRLLTLPLATVLPDLEHHGIATGVRSSSHAALTLAELFSDPVPSLELLLVVKESARRCARAKEPPLPIDLASLFYFAAIAVAQQRLGKRISKLDPYLIRQGIEKLQSQPWIGEPFLRLFAAAGMERD